MMRELEIKKGDSFIELINVPINVDDINVTYTTLTLAINSRDVFKTSKGVRIHGVNGSYLDIPYKDTKVDDIVVNSVDELYIWFKENSFSSGGSSNRSIKISDIENLEEAIGSKNGLLISGLNIKTLNNESILGEGNIDFPTTDLSNYYSKPDLNQLLNNKVDDSNIVGFVSGASYNSLTYEITLNKKDESDLVISLPIESLISNVVLVDSDLLFTFEGGDQVTIPLNTLLVGVIKNVNGKSPNAQGRVDLSIADIVNLQSNLDSKIKKPTNNSSVPILNSSGVVSELSYSTTANVNSFVVRDTNGRFSAVDPVLNHQVTTKGYVDTKFTVIKSTVNGWKVREYFDRIEYSVHIPVSFSLGTGGYRYGTFVSTVKSPSGINLANADEHYLSLINPTRTVCTAIYQYTDNSFRIGLFNNYNDVSSSEITGSLFVKLVRYK